MEEFILYLEDNTELVESVFVEYYNEQATVEGENMQGNEMFGGSDSYDEDPITLYEDFAHTTGHSAHYAGAEGVIREIGIQGGFEVEVDDEELQWEILVLLDREF